MKKIIFNPRQWLEIIAYATGLLSLFVVIVLSLSAVMAANLFASAPGLGEAESFEVLSGSTVTNTGDTIVNGDLGVYSGTDIGGFPPGIVHPPGVIHACDAVAQTAQSGALAVYNALAGEACDYTLSRQDLVGKSPNPGVFISDN